MCMYMVMYGVCIVYIWHVVCVCLACVYGVDRLDMVYVSVYDVSMVCVFCVLSATPLLQHPTLHVPPF